MEKTNSNRIVAKLGRMMPLLAVGAVLLSACGTSTSTSPDATVTTGTGAAMTTATSGMAEGMSTATVPMDGGMATVTAGMSEASGTAMSGSGTAVTAAGTAGTGVLEGVATNVAGTINGSLLTLEMGQQNNSGESGKATLTDMGNGKIKVVLDLNNGTADPQPAHIHKGSCANLDPTPLIPLNNVVNGKSETEVEATMAMLTSGHAINVHKSATDIPTYVSCADIKGTATMMEGTPGMMEGTPSPGMMESTPGAMQSTPEMMSGTPTP
ncbi:MAG TPA: hypothetical protein VM409_04120 [Chloroflexia bacterium]|nr:hypothetical protein [Chloroflexia bacterium]